MKINPAIFKAYDIRGIYPSELNEKLAYRLGQGYAKVIKPKGPVAVGMDVRIHSPFLKEALIKGLLDSGLEVIDIGLSSVEMLYFAVGHYGYGGGIEVTGSHNPRDYNGMKMVKKGVEPISSETGLLKIRDLILKGQEQNLCLGGKRKKRKILKDFASFCLKFIDPEKIKPFKLVYNPNFGFQGEVIKEVVKVGKLPIELIGLNDRPNGTFPKGRPDPFIPENRPEFIELVKSSKAEIGVAWDADGDRAFFCTKKGHFVEPYYMNALFIAYFLERHRKATIVYDPRYKWALVETVQRYGGQAVLERVGHSFIKARMRKERAIFCGESSGHTYFRDFWFADSGMIPLLIVLEIISFKGGLDSLLEPYFKKYFISGEINSYVDNSSKIIAKFENKYSSGKMDHLDGLSVEYPNWRFNLRPSNTEPLLRLNIEAKTKKLLEEKKKELTQLIKD